MSEPDNARNFRVYQVIENAPERLEVYRFHHPTAGHRKNLAVLQWDAAGRIEWPTTTSGTVWFGVDEVPIKDLRRIKNGTSQSRRFKCSGNEYKWKIAGNGQDLFVSEYHDCHALVNVEPLFSVSIAKINMFAIWTAQEMSLKIAPRCVTILERIVITCFLNLWFKGLNRW
ncbi:hypothetical protein BKA83DRAFT_4188034 [Pisolithus microcarpus]|nr:hypothetical protein BKA83DRAFT_4188034 [Pisolithus microcarpus]